MSLRSPRLAAAVTMALVLAAGCRAGADKATTTVTTAATTTSTSQPATTTTSMPGPSAIVVADDDGIELIEDGIASPALQGRSIAVALPDLDGGLVLQQSEQRGEEWPPQPVPIEWIPTVGAEPVVLVDGAGSNMLTPLQVAWIEGRRQLLYRSLVVDESADPWEEGAMVEYLVARDLSSGDERVLGIIGAYESSETDLDLAAGLVTVAWAEYGGSGACAGVAGLDDLLALESEEWVGTICGGECCAFGPTPGCGFGIPCQADEEVGSIRAALSPDGTKLLMAETHWPDETTLSEIDVASGTIRRQLIIPAAEASVHVVESDGARTIVGLTTADGSPRFVLVEEGGSFADIPGARWASFWRTEEVPLPWLRGDGFGTVDFGTPMDEGMAALTAFLGTPSGEVVAQPPWPDPVGGCQVATGYDCTDYYRAVDWTDLGLSVTFLDGPDGVSRLGAWRYWGPSGGPAPSRRALELTTVTGLTAPTTVDDLRNRLDEVSFGSDVCGGCCAFRVEQPGGTIFGTLSGEPGDSATRVTSLSAGARSSC